MPRGSNNVWAVAFPCNCESLPRELWSSATYTYPETSLRETDSTGTSCFSVGKPYKIKRGGEIR